MRILLVLLSVNFNGTERHAVELANALASEHDVALLLRARPHEAERQAAYATLRGAVAPSVHVFTAARAMPAVGMLAAIARFRPEVIHTHYERSARWATRLAFGIPVIATAHCGCAPDFDRCAGLICLTDQQRAEAATRFTGRVWRIGNWVLPRSRLEAAARQGLRDSLGLAAGDFVVGCVARFDPEKGQDGLIDAFLRAELPNGRLVLVGAGGNEAALRARAAASAGRVVVAGFRADVRDLVQCFDTFALNSTVEQFPLALLEALDAGLPVIATATDGAREIAARVPLHLVPIGDADALVAQLRRAASGALAPAADGAGPFRIAAVLPKIVAAYAEVASAPGTRARSAPRAAVS
jgi:glycosyltransferase involved in cell wall biosynthesis